MNRLSRSSHDRIVELIIPLVRTESERSGLLSSAFSDHPALIDRVNLSGSPSAFAAHLLQTLLDYGEVEPGVPAVWRLLDSLRERVGQDKQRQIDALKPTILAALSASDIAADPPEPGVKRLLIVSGLVTAVIVVIAAIRAFAPPASQINPTDTPPSLTVAPAPTETAVSTQESTQTTLQPTSGAPPTAFTLFRDPDSLTLYIPGAQNADLGDLTLTVDGSNAPSLASYPAFVGLPLSALPTPICLRLERSGSAQPLPQSCPAETTVTQPLANADVFWHASNQDRTVLIRRGGALITFCAAGQSRCEFAYADAGDGSGSNDDD